MNIDEIPRNIRNFCSAGKFNLFDKEIFESFGNILKNSNVSMKTTQFAIICKEKNMVRSNVLYAANEDEKYSS